MTSSRIRHDQAAKAIAQASEIADRIDGEFGIFARRSHGEALAEHLANPVEGPLTGMTLGVKDIIFDSSGRTRAGSAVQFSPEAQPEATAIGRLKEAGAVVVGKTTTMEFALGLPETITNRNPWDPNRWAGGSSSGSGSGVVLGCFTAGIGTDTTGSLRIPAAYTGTTSIKPTQGRVPASGVYPLAPSMDTVGPIARSVVTCARLLQVMAGHSPDDPGSSHAPVGDYIGALDHDVSGLKVGVLDLAPFADAGIDDAQPETFQRTLDHVRSLGASLVEVELPQYPLLNAVGNVLMLAESHEIHRDLLAQQWSNYGRSARWVFSAGEQISSSDYLRAQRLRTMSAKLVDSLFAQHGLDLVVAPTCHLQAPVISDINPLDPTTYLGSMHTTAWSVSGHPVVTLPIGLGSNGLPLSMSIIAPHWAESAAIALAAAYQRQTDHHERKPETA